MAPTSCTVTRIKQFINRKMIKITRTLLNWFASLAAATTTRRLKPAVFREAMVSCEHASSPKSGAETQNDLGFKGSLTGLLFVLKGGLQRRRRLPHGASCGQEEGSNNKKKTPFK